MAHLSVLLQAALLASAVGEASAWCAVASSSMVQSWGRLCAAGGTRVLPRRRAASLALCTLRASSRGEVAALADQLMGLQLPMKPSPEYAPEDIVRYIVKGLQYNDLPEPNTGLRRWFAFSNAMCRTSVAGDAERGKVFPPNEENWADNFIKYAKNPTFQAMINLQSVKMEDINLIPATETRGALATQLERRPPMAGCWLVRQCLYTANAIDLTI